MPFRVLLDECVPRQLKREIGPPNLYEVRTAREMGWDGPDP